MNLPITNEYVSAGEGKKKKGERHRKLTQRGRRSVLFWLQECDQLVVSPGRGQSRSVPACLCPSPSVGAAQPCAGMPPK